MNSNQFKGSLKDAVGKVQQKVGKALGSTRQRAKGLAKQAEGKIQKSVGDMQHQIKRFQ